MHLNAKKSEKCSLVLCLYSPINKEGENVFAHTWLAAFATGASWVLVAAGRWEHRDWPLREWCSQGKSWSSWAYGISSVVWYIPGGLKYSEDSLHSEAGQSSYLRNTLLTISTLRNGLWVYLGGVGFSVTGVMKYMDAAKFRLVGHEDF